LPVLAAAAADHGMVAQPARVSPVAQSPIFPPIQKNGVKNAQDKQMRQGNKKNFLGDQGPDTHAQKENGSQIPGFVPDLPVREGPGQAHPDPTIGARPPEEHQYPQPAANRGQQVTDSPGHL